MRFLFSICLALLTACSSTPTEDNTNTPPGTKLSYISLISHKGFNENTAATVDLLVVYDKKLYAYCKELSAKSYLEKIDQIRRDNMSLVSIFRWEMVPSQVLESYRLLISEKQKVYGILLFTDYKTTGHHRAAIDSDAVSIRAHLGQTDIEALEKDVKNTVNKKETFRVYPLETTITLNATSPTQGTINEKKKD